MSETITCDSIMRKVNEFLKKQGKDKLKNAKPIIIISNDPILKTLDEAAEKSKEILFQKDEELKKEIQDVKTKFWNDVHDRLIDLQLAIESEREDDFSIRDGVLFHDKSEN